MREFYPLPEQIERAVLGVDGRFRREPGPVPEPGPRDLLFRLQVAGLTAADTDPALHPDRTPPGLPVGEVAAVGDRVRGWNPLDRALVIPPPAAPGEPSWAGLADHFLVPAGMTKKSILHRLPVGYPDEDATLLPAVALAARIVRETRVRKPESVLVLGLGLVGQVVTRMARHHGLTVVLAADPSATLRKRAEYSGATAVIRLPEDPVPDAVAAGTGGAGVDAIVVLHPDPTPVREALPLLRPRGTLILGAPLPPSFRLGLPGAELQRHELRVAGVNGFEARDLRDAHRALRQGIADAETLVSRRVAWPDLSATEFGPGFWEHGIHVVVEGPEPAPDFPEPY